MKTYSIMINISQYEYMFLLIYKFVDVVKLFLNKRKH